MNLNNFNNNLFKATTDLFAQLGIQLNSRYIFADKLPIEEITKIIICD